MNLVVVLMSKLTQESMEKILAKLVEISRELKEIKESGKNLQKDNKDLRKELKMYQQKMEEENKELKWKVKTLEEKIKVIEDKEEQKEKKKRKNNIIISEKLETNLKEDKQRMKEHIQKLCEKLSNEEVIVQDTEYIMTNAQGMDLVRVGIKTFEQKLSIMKNKYRLARNSDKIYIEDDFTKEERRIQSILRKKGKEEREKGNKVKIGYKKINVNSKWIKWEDLEKNL